MTNTQSEIMQENHYYPFGLNHEGPFQPQQPVENMYQYNGKELNEEFGLNWNDYGKRWYDPAVGRFTTVDPESEKYAGWSPYNYVLGNPIRNIDPQGDTVRVYSQTIPSTYHAQRHLYLRVTTDEYDKIVEVFGPNEDEAARGTAIPQIYDFSDNEERPGLQEHTVERPEGVGENNTEFEEQILELAEFFGESETVTENGKEKADYVNLPEYGYYKDNSNGYVNGLVKLSGGKLKNIPWNATGVNSTKSYENAVNQSDCESICKPLYNQ